MEIYLDVDDTLADFREHAVALGVPRWECSWYTTDPATWTQEQKDIQQATNDLMTRRDFWLTMPVAPGAFELIAAAASRARTSLLTAMPSFSNGFPELQDMIRKAKLEYAHDVLHFPTERVIICPRAHKVSFARVLLRDNVREGPAYQNNLLVDDAEQNVDEWCAAGGNAIHHKIGDMASTIAAVKGVGQ